MPFIFEQPNLDNEAESHLYFDPGDGRLITVFTHEGRERRGTPVDEKGRDAFTTSHSRCRRRPSTKWSSGSTNAGSSTAA